MNYETFLKKIENCPWHEIESELAVSIRNNPNDPIFLVCGAHLSLRQGEPLRARILAEKALSLDPNCEYAFIESAIADFYLDDLEKAYLALSAHSLGCLPFEHPAHLAIVYLRFIFDEQSLMPQNNALQCWARFIGNQEIVESFIKFAIVDPQGNNTLAFNASNLPDIANTLLARGDKLATIFFAKLCQVLAPTSADSFLAVGLVNLHLGFLESASRALHEAAFRQVDTSLNVLWLELSLYCRQQRFDQAVEISNKLIEFNAMGFDGLGLHVDLLVRCNTNPAHIEEFLQKIYIHEGGLAHPAVRIAVLRHKLQQGMLTPEDVLNELTGAPELSSTATGMYLQAHLLKDAQPKLARSLANQAITVAPFHPDAANWINESTSQSGIFEYMGLFLPTEHEGCAWPNDRQIELLKVIFSNTPEVMRDRWNTFLTHHEIDRLDAGCYRLLPLLHTRLNNTCPDENWSKKELLKGVWKKSFLENSTRLNSIVALTHTLNQFGIRFQVLKGLANAILLYGDLGARPMTDIDILIKPKDLDTCHEVLTKQGWNCDAPPTPQRIRFQYASTYLHPSGGNLDLHWRPSEEFTTDFYNPDDLGRHAAFSWMGNSFETLNPAANLACTILHGVAWNHLSPVRWVSDAMLIIKKSKLELDWGLFESLSNKYQFKNIVVSGLCYLVTHFPDFERFVPNHLLENSAEADQIRLLQIRCRSRTVPADLQDILALATKLRAQFNLEVTDQIWACASHFDPKDIDDLSNKNILWLPVYDPDIFNSQLLEKGATNCLVLDANHNGYLQTVCPN